VNFLDAANGVSAIPMADVNCPVIAPELGIIGTPVIDPAAGTLYAIAATREPGPAYVYRLHALDVTSGAERAGSPVVIQAAGFVARLWFERRYGHGRCCGRDVVDRSRFVGRRRAALGALAASGATQAAQQATAVALARLAEFEAVDASGRPTPSGL